MIFYTRENNMIKHETRNRKCLSRVLQVIKQKIILKITFTKTNNKVLFFN